MDDLLHFVLAMIIYAVGMIFWLDLWRPMREASETVDGDEAAQS
jgi:hypothetical protein